MRIGNSVSSGTIALKTAQACHADDAEKSLQH
jgi:hypothetical protein